MTTPASLGWVKETDPEKLAGRANFPMRALLPEAARPVMQMWDFVGPKLDQGNTGTCVGHAMKDFLICQPIDQSPQDQPPTAIDLYIAGRRLAGLQPPDDLQGGCTTDGGWKALKEAGFIKEYRWATSIDDILDWLAFQGPLTVGTDWTQDMFRPGSDGFVHPTGTVVGGHEYLLRGYAEVEGQTYIRCVNSWGNSWDDHGEFNIWASDLEQLVFHQGGDAAVGLEVSLNPTPPPTPAPAPQPAPPAPTPAPAPAVIDPQTDLVFEGMVDGSFNYRQAFSWPNGGGPPGVAPIGPYVYQSDAVWDAANNRWDITVYVEKYW